VAICSGAWHTQAWLNLEAECRRRRSEAEKLGWKLAESEESLGRYRAEMCELIRQLQARVPRRWHPAASGKPAAVGGAAGGALLCRLARCKRVARSIAQGPTPVTVQAATKAREEQHATIQSLLAEVNSHLLGTLRMLAGQQGVSPAPKDGVGGPRDRRALEEQILAAIRASDAARVRVLRAGLPANA
jgi:hypothetical protein